MTSLHLFSRRKEDSKRSMVATASVDRMVPHPLQKGAKKQKIQQIKLQRLKGVYHSTDSLPRTVRRPMSLQQLLPHKVGEEKMSDDQIGYIRDMGRSLLGAVNGINAVYPLHLMVTYDLVSSAGSSIQLTVVDGTGIFNANDYSALLNLFDEILLLGKEVCVTSRNKYSKTTTNSNSIVLQNDDNSTPVLTGYATNSQQAVFSNTDDLFPDWLWFPAPRNPIPDNAWQDMNALTQPGGLSFFANNLSATTTYGLVVVRYHCLFRMQFS